MHQINLFSMRSTLLLMCNILKWSPCFIGPFPIIEVNMETSTYRLELTEEYKIHAVFHAGLLKSASPNDPTLFPVREPPPPDPVFAEEKNTKMNQY